MVRVKDKAQDRFRTVRITCRRYRVRQSEREEEEGGIRERGGEVTL